MAHTSGLAGPLDIRQEILQRKPQKQLMCLADILERKLLEDNQFWICSTDPQHFYEIFIPIDFIYWNHHHLLLVETQVEVITEHNI